MFDVLMQSAAMALTMANFLAIFLGVTIGTVVGAIPGMTVVMAVALALPLTFSLDPLTGLFLLLGIYKGGTYGGSITAITIKTPGTSAAACTVLDGYPLSVSGNSRKALDMSLYASISADVISNISLIFFAGWLAAFALDFGPPEYFTLAVFSLTIIASVSGTRLINGIMSACLGLFCATIGLDLLFGLPRLTMGVPDLYSGIAFIPLLIGLFALPEIINNCVTPTDSNSNSSNMPTQGEPLTFKEFWACRKAILRGSLIGVILGAIPGLGSTPAAFLSYSESRRTSKHPELYGKGSLEGVAAAESGNNGVAGSTLVPLLSLGVPGDVVTAIMLGAFMVHDIKPGPLLFQENIGIVYSLFIGILISSPCLFIVGKAAIRIFSQINVIPRNLLFAIVMAFCIFGSFALNNSAFDIFIMFSMGGIGFIMQLCKIPPAPFVIAFVLGSMIEDSFRQSLIASGNNFSVFISSPITIVFWILTLASLYFALRNYKQTAKMNA